MRVEAKQVISPNKPSKSTTRRAQELRTILSKARGENFVTEGSREPSRRTGPRIPPGLEQDRLGDGRRLLSRVSRAQPSGPRSIWGCRPLVAATSAASRAVPRRARAAPCPRAEGLELLRAAPTRLRPPR